MNFPYVVFFNVRYFFCPSLTFFFRPRVYICELRSRTIIRQIFFDCFRFQICTLITSKIYKYIKHVFQVFDM